MNDKSVAHWFIWLFLAAILPINLFCFVYLWFIRKAK
jgi:hypothetical protein